LNVADCIFLIHYAFNKRVKETGSVIIQFLKGKKKSCYTLWLCITVLYGPLSMLKVADSLYVI